MDIAGLRPTQITPQPRRSLARLLRFLATLCLGYLAHTPCTALDAGVAAVDLTPPASLKAALGGYGERQSRPATGIRDRVWVKAVVLREGSRRGAIVTADLLAFPPGFRDEVAASLQPNAWAPEQLLLLASHTHTSLDLMSLNRKNNFGIPELGLYQKDVADWAVARCTEAVARAEASLQPVHLGSGTRRLEGWNRNRRQGVAVDRDLTLARLDTAAGVPLAVLVNWTAHPTFMGPEHMEFSGDWPGHLQRTLQSVIGQSVTVLFFNGAEGDQSPTPRLASQAPAWEQAECYGRDLALEAWRLWQTVQPQPAPVFHWQTSPVPLPLRTAHPDFLQTGGKEYGLTADNVGALLEVLCPATSHCTAVRLGDLLLTGIPGELTADLGLQLKTQVRTRTQAKYVAIAGLADEWISYMLSPDEYRQGGYEASVSFYGPDLGPRIVQAAAEVAQRAW